MAFKSTTCTLRVYMVYCLVVENIPNVLCNKLVLAI